MKKILFLSIALILSFNSSYAKDYSEFCSTNSANKTFLGNIASISGYNLISRNIIEGQIAKALKKETNSKFDVKIDSFFGTNVNNGEFKSLKANSDNIFYNGIYMSDVNIETICDYNKVDYKNKTLAFDENLALKYSASITQDDLDKLLKESSYQKTLDKMNSDSTISSLIQIKNSNIKIKDDKLEITYNILPLAKLDAISIFKNKIKPIKITIGANLKIEDGNIELCDLDFNNVKAKYNNLIPVINMLNPLSFDVDIDKITKGELDIENVKIANSKILIEGSLLIPKTKI